MNEEATRGAPSAEDPRSLADERAGTVPGRVLEVGEGGFVALGPVRVEYKLRAEDGAGFSLLVYSLSGRFEAPPAPHWHTREHFVSFVLEGELCFHLAQGERRLSAGAFLHLPPGAPFAWSNPHDAPARFLCAWAPAGFEAFFGDVAAGLRAVGSDAPPTAAAMAEVIPPLWREYGVCGPPPQRG